MSSTTIKVPVELRDRLAVLAGREHTTLAGAIARVPGRGRERRVLGRCREKTMSDTPSVFFEAEQIGGSLSDGLDPEESWDDVW